MRLKHVSIKNFRGIKQADLTFPDEQRVVCLIGPGDSTKSTILTAIHYALWPSWNLSVSSSDFYDCNTDEQICIEVSFDEFPDSFLKEQKYGLYLRGSWNAEADEPTETNCFLTARLIMMGIVPVDPKDEQMYVATVPDKVHGAGVLAYKDFLEQAAERAGGDFFIIPSSIHELLIVPDNGQMDLSSLESMVKEVNATQVAPEDKLTDSVYHYDSREKIFELGEKFVERQALQNAREEHDPDKEMRDSLDEKSSVLGDLEAKKEETARAPKKESVERGTRSKGGEAI